MISSRRTLPRNRWPTAETVILTLMSLMLPWKQEEKYDSEGVVVVTTTRLSLATAGE